MGGSISYAFIFVQLVVTVLSFFLARRVYDRPHIADKIPLIGVSWVLLSTCLFWMFGPFSFNAIQFELDFSVPIQQYIATLPPGTRFAHEFSGGMDAYTLNQFNGQYFSFDRWLVSALPTWMGLGLYRIFLFSLGTLGTYLLGRSLGSDKVTALSVGMLFSVANDGVTIHAFHNGLAIAALPLAIYLTVARAGQKYYWTGVIVFGLIHATSSTVPPTALNYLVAIPLAALIIAPRRLPQVIGGLAIIMALVVLNLHEMIYAMLTVAPYTARGAGQNAVQLGFDLPVQLLKASPEILIAFAACAVALIPFRHDLAQRSVVIRAFTITMLFTPMVAILPVLPWDLIGLKMVGNLGWQHLYSTLAVLAALALLAFVNVFRTNRRAHIYAVSLIAALAIGKLAYYDAYSAAHWISNGGLTYAHLDDLKNPTWAPKTPFRILSVPYRMAENQAPALGFESASGITSLQPATTVPFWRAVNTVDPDEKITYSTGPSITVRFGEDQFKCCMTYDIETLGIDIGLLKVANIQFIFSRLPLSGGGLKKVAGPPDGTVLPRSGTPYRDRIGPYVRWIVDPDPVYVYELPAPVPRVFAPTSVDIVADDANQKEFLGRVSEIGPENGLVLRASDADVLQRLAPSTGVESYTKVLNGYDVELSGDAGGLVVFNVPFTPFWTATVDGRSVPIVSANGIHMAVSVPAGHRSLILRYNRLLLREKIGDLIFGNN